MSRDTIDPGVNDPMCSSPLTFLSVRVLFFMDPAFGLGVKGHRSKAVSGEKLHNFSIGCAKVAMCLPWMEVS